MTTDTNQTSARETAQQTASTAVGEGQHVAGVAADEVRGLAGEAAHQARSIVDDTVGQVRGQLDDQGRQQKDRLAGTLGSLGEDFGRMAESGSGLAADLAHEMAGRAQALSRHLEDHEPGELLDDARRFARERPGTFLLGALAAGVVVGRLVRGTKDAVEAADSGGQSSPGAHTAGSSAGPSASPRVTPGAQNTADVHDSHGQATRPPVTGTSPPSSTGYSSPPLGAGLPGSGSSNPETGPVG